MLDSMDVTDVLDRLKLLRTILARASHAKAIAQKFKDTGAITQEDMATLLLTLTKREHKIAYDNLKRYIAEVQAEPKKVADPKKV